MEAAIKTISEEIEIKCKKCGYEGAVIATRVYYIGCPECDKMIYVGHLTSKV